VTPTFHISQYDVGRVLGLIVHSGGATVDLDAYTCSIEATRSDGTAITSAVATTDNIGTFEVTPTMSNKADKYKCQLVIVDENSKRIASLPFSMEVTKAAMDENAEAIEEDASLYQQYTEAVQGAIAETNADIQAEENARIAAVSAEATARQTADTTLQNNITAETTARQTADNTLQGNINSEASTRATQDASLQSQINQIIAPSGEAPSAAEVQNARIGANGVTYDTLGNAIRGQVTDLKSAINGINVIGKIRLSQTINKFVDGINHVLTDGTGDTSITTVDIIFTDRKIQLDCPAGYQYIVFTYTTNVWASENYIGSTGWKTGKYTIPANVYFVIQFRRENSVAFDSAEDKNILTVNESIGIVEDIETDEKIFDGQLEVLAFRKSQKINKFVNGITHLLEDGTGNITMTNDKIQYANRETKVCCPDGYEFVVFFFSSSVWITENYITATSWVKEYIIQKGTYYVVQFRREGSTAFTNGEDDKYILNFANLAYRDVYTYIDELSEISSIIPFRESQKINKFVNGITFLLEDGTGNKLITNDKIQYADRNVTLNCDSSYEYLVNYFSSKTWTTENHINGTAWKSGKYIIQKGSYYVVQFRKRDLSAFSGENDKNLLVFRDVPEEDQTLYHIIVTGQSLAVGAEGNPALTTVTPYNFIGKAYQFNGGSRPIDGMENDTGVEEIAILDSCLDYFASLREQTHVVTLGSGEDIRHGYQGETIDSAMGYWFASLTGHKVLVSNHGFGGKSYTQLKKGTTAYNNSIRAVYHAKELCDRLGWKYVVYAIAVVHGEADYYASQTADEYKAHLHEWQTDYNTDIKAITGQIDTVQMFVSQTVASSSYNLSYNHTANGAFLADIQYDDIHLVCPQYAYPITYASVHMNNYGYRALGEFFGFVMGKKFIGSDDCVLYPISSSLTGTKITLSFNGISGDTVLVNDGINVAAVSDGHWGFELIDDENKVSITDVQIVDDTVEITLSGTPSSDAKISYAYKTLPDEMGYIGRTRGVRGNLRNKYGFNSMFTNHSTPQWCCVFCVPVNWSAS
jgi:hypothetical protein